MGKRVNEAVQAYGAAAPEKEVSASDLKNAWHEHLERVRRGREEIVVTHYGRPIAKLVPYEGEEAPDLFGWLSGTVTVHGDIVAPTGEDWDADA